MYQVGDKVEVEYDGTWYDGVVVKVLGGLLGVRVNEKLSNGLYLNGYGLVVGIHTKGIRKLIPEQYRIGEEVEISEGSNWYKATITEIGRNTLMVRVYQHVRGTVFPVFKKDVRKLTKAKDVDNLLNSVDNSIKAVNNCPCKTEPNCYSCLIAGAHSSKCNKCT